MTQAERIDRLVVAMCNDLFLAIDQDQMVVIVRDHLTRVTADYDDHEARMKHMRTMLGKLVVTCQDCLHDLDKPPCQNCQKIKTILRAVIGPEVKPQAGKLWVVGDYKSKAGLAPTWELIGVMSSEADADAACLNDHHFYAEVGLDAPFYGSAVFPAAVYPRVRDRQAQS